MGTKKSSLQNVLFTKTQQRVLGLLFGKPDADFHTNEIIRLARVGTGTAQRELEKLTAAGLIKMKKVGNQKRYQANREAPLFSELRNIVLKTFGLADILRQALKPVIKKMHVGFIYGSIAKNEDTANSDIDLMLIGDNMTYTDLFPLLEGAEKILGRRVNPTFYSPFEWTRKYKEGNNFITQVIKQSKIYLVGNEDELSKLR